MSGPVELKFPVVARFDAAIAGVPGLKMCL